MHKNIFPGRTLYKAISLGSVEPLHCSLLFHRHYSFRISYRVTTLLHPSRRKKEAVSFGRFPSPSIKGLVALSLHQPNLAGCYNFAAGTGNPEIASMEFL